MMRNSFLLSLWVIMISMAVLVPTTKADEKQNIPVTVLAYSEGLGWNWKKHPTSIVHVPAVPKKYFFNGLWRKRNAPAKLPLVINLHALGSNAFLQMQISGFNEIADQEGFIVLYPNGRSPPNLPASLDVALDIGLVDVALDNLLSSFQEGELKKILKESINFVLGVSSFFVPRVLTRFLDRFIDDVVALFAQGRSWNAGGCCGNATDQQQDDISFLRKQIDYVKNTMPTVDYHNFEVDMERIYVTGMSNGGFMTHRVACEMSDIIAAAAPVAGPLSNDRITENDASYKAMWKTETFECGGPVPIYYFHNKQDLIVPYEGSKNFGMPSAEETVEKWRKINNLPSDQSPQVESFDDETTMSELYSDPSDPLGSKGQSAPVQLFTLDSKNALGHCWPGNGGILSNLRCDTSKTDSGFIYSKLRMHTKPKKDQEL